MNLRFKLYRFQHRAKRRLRHYKRMAWRVWCTLYNHDWRDSSGWHGHTETCNRCLKFKWIERSKYYKAQMKDSL